jgi:hypothetical protein
LICLWKNVNTKSSNIGVSDPYVGYQRDKAQT